MLRRSSITMAALTVMTVSAFADEDKTQEWSADVLQSFTGVQDALNSLVIEETTSPITQANGIETGQTGETPIVRPEFDVVLGGENRQLITNAANILVATETFVDSLTQSTTGQQIATNEVFTEGEVGQVGNFVQLGENLTNVVEAKLVNDLTQQFGPGAIQSVENTFVVGGNTGTISQIGRNTANVARAEISIGPGSQSFPFDTVQTISNRVHLTSANPVEFGMDPEEIETIASLEIVETQGSPTDTMGMGLSELTEGAQNGAIIQEGQNFGNVLVADEVRDVSRVFNGEQRVVNSVVVDGPEDLPTSVTQIGLNIANFVSASEVSGLTQETNGVQIVENTVTDSTLASLTSQLPNYSQTSENYVNVLNIVGGEERTEGLSLSAGQNNTAQQASVSSGRSLQVSNSVNVTR